MRQQYGEIGPTGRRSTQVGAATGHHPVPAPTSLNQVGARRGCPGQAGRGLAQRVLGLDQLGGARAAEQVALATVAADLAQARQLQRGLDALGDHRQAEGVAELDDGLDDRRVLGVDAQAVDERAVDLDRLDREPLQVGERRVAGAEVVDGEVQAEAAQLARARPWPPSRRPSGRSR